MLNRLATALRTIGQGSREESFEWIGKNAPSVEPIIRDAVERAPKAIMKVLTDLILELALKTNDPALHQALLTLGTDPRNFREAADTIEGIDWLLEGHKTKPLVEQSLQILADRGVLGLSTLERLAMFLRSVQLRPHTLRLEPGGKLRSGDAVLDIDQVMAFGRSLGAHSVMWGRRAAHDSAFEAFGAAGEVAGPWSRQEGTLPASFANADALEILRSWEMAKIPGQPTPDDEENARRLYFGLWAIHRLMQPEWWGRFRPDLVFSSKEKGVHYSEPRRSIILGSGVAPLAGVIEALLQAVDHNLLDCRSFASETDGHPMSLFVGMLDSMYPESLGREKFARFTEHYMRIYLNQLGDKYAPIDSEGDPSAVSVAAMSKNFMDALVEAQKIDIEDEITKAGAAEMHGFGASAASAGAVVLGSAVALT